VLFSPSWIATGGCFPRARLQPPRENHSPGSSDTCYSRRSHRPPLTRTDKINGKKSVISKRYTSNPYTRRLLEKENRFFCVRCFSKKLSLSCGRKGIGGTPQCVSTRRPTSRPRKA